MKLSQKEVLQIATLSRLELTEEEVETFSHQLSDVLSYVEQLSKIDTENVEETSQVTGLVNVFRPDEVHPFENPENLVNQAAEHQDNMVKVKNVL